MNTAPRISGRRGFAAILAITLILLIGGTLVAVANAFAVDARRTRLIGHDAQLRQLLTAGAIAAMEQVRSGKMPQAEGSIPLPHLLAHDGTSLKHSAAAVDGDAATITVTATLPGRTMGQTLTFARRQDQWMLVSARLQ